MIVLVVNLDVDPAITDAEQLLERYTTLTGWSSALVNAGAERVAVLQKFRRDLTIVRNGVEYVFSSTLRQTRRTIRRGKPDVAHVNGLQFAAQAAAMRMWLPRRTAIVVQDHGGREPRGEGGFRRPFDSLRSLRTRPFDSLRSLRARLLRGTAMRLADGFLFTALEQAEPWRTAGLITAKQAVYAVLEASTTLTPIARVAAREMSRVAGDPAVLWVGRLNANKDPLTVLEGFERALARLPRAGLTMVFSEADLLDAVRARIEGSAIARHVSLVGRVPHHLMASYYSAADFFVLGSHHEGSGYALIEALACGVVPVVTNIPSFRTITGNGSLGSLWQPDDPASFAAALITIAERDIGAERARVLEEFNRRLSWPAVGRDALAAYADIIARRVACRRT